MESKKIQIIAHARSTFRPRTLNESKIASHYLRCEPNSQFEYPTIHVCHRTTPLSNSPWFHSSYTPNGLVNR